MGTVTSIEARGRGTPSTRTSTRTIAHIRHAIGRYRRDLALMLGERAPADGNPDDVAMLERFAAAGDQSGMIGEWVVRITTLEAMITLLREEASARRVPGRDPPGEPTR